MSKKEIIKPALILTAICFAVAGLLGLTNYITQDKIAKAKADSIAEAMENLVPDARFDQIDQNTYTASNGGEISAYVFITEEMGYKSKIEVMTAVNAEGSIIGVTVTGCADESPGIGQKVGSEKSFTDQFTGQSTSAEADAITGATFSSKAVTKAVNNALEKFSEIKEGN